MKTDIPAAAGASVVVTDGWAEAFDGLLGVFAGRFKRAGTARLAGQMITGMLAGLGRTNCWTLGEYLGHAGPDRLQSLLADAAWDHDGVRDDLRGYVIDQLGSQGAVAVLDETGDLKQGKHTVGVARQYTGTAGKIANAQVAVFLIWATDKGAAFIDRRLYLPTKWTDDPERMAGAGVPADVVFATKPAQGAAMIGACLDAGHRPAWVSGDEVYGGNPGLRAFLHEQRIAYVIAVKRTEPVTTEAGTFCAVDLAVRPKVPYARISAGTGTQGQRWYDWALVHLEPPPGQDGMFALLVRRALKPGKDGKKETEFYLAYSPVPVRLGQLVHVAGTRWRIEEGFAASKELAALDQHQVRTWTSWHRWTVLAMAAVALLTIIAAGQGPPPEGLIAWTRNEIRHLLTRITWAAAHSLEHILAWSTWRRKRQHTACTSHHKRQDTRTPNQHQEQATK